MGLLRKGVRLIRNLFRREDRKDAKAAKNDPQPHLFGVGHPSGFSFASLALLRVLCVKCGFQVECG
jgi:hypothetical protein